MWPETTGYSLALTFLGGVKVALIVAVLPGCTVTEDALSLRPTASLVWVSGYGTGRLVVVSIVSAVPAGMCEMVYLTAFLPVFLMVKLWEPFQFAVSFRRSSPVDKTVLNE